MSAPKDLKTDPRADRWDADRYVRDAAFVPRLGRPVLDLLAPHAGERILDLGCGDGALSLELQEAGVSVVAVDASADMVAAACARGLDARVMDGQALSFEAEFDAVFSNAALHWMRRDPDAVIAGAWRALRPGGRFIAEMGGAGNVAEVEHAIAAELASRGLDVDAVPRRYYPTVAEYTARLSAGGFEVQHIERFPRPTELPGDLVGWLQVFGGEHAALLPGDQREDFYAAIQRRAAPALRQADGRWLLDYVRLRFVARRPASA
jgi:Trans-aconitate methyltransferase